MVEKKGGHPKWREGFLFVCLVLKKNPTGLTCLKKVVLFYLSSRIPLDYRSLSHTNVENIPVQCTKVSNPSSCLSISVYVQ